MGSIWADGGGGGGLGGGGGDGGDLFGPHGSGGPFRGCLLP